MLDSTILTITGDAQLLTILREQLHDHVGPGSRMIVAPTIDEACSLLETTRARLVVLHWARDQASGYHHIDRLLWTTTVMSRRAPILVIAERYRTDQATMLFRMGVSEYISRTHHLDQLGRVFSTFLPHPTEAAAAPLVGRNGESRLTTSVIAEARPRHASSHIA